MGPLDALTKAGDTAIWRGIKTTAVKELNEGRKEQIAVRVDAVEAAIARLTDDLKTARTVDDDARHVGD